MDSNILNLLQGLSDPSDLAAGMCSYFKKHTSRVRDLLDRIISRTPADPDDDGHDFDLGSGILVIGNDGHQSRSLSLTNLTRAIKAVLADNDSVPPIPIEVRDYAAGTTNYESLTYDQVIQLIREQSDVGDALITTLTSYKDWLNNPDTNFEQLLLGRANNLLSQGSVVADKLKQGLTSIATRYSDGIRENAPSVLQNIMSLFGVGTSTYSDQQVSTFEGVNAWTVVLGDIVDGVTHVIQQVPNFVGRLFGTIGFAIGKMVEFATNRLKAGVERTIISITGADNAFKATSFGGDRTVSGCDWRYTVSKQYYLSGDTTFQNLVDKLEEYWDNSGNTELSIPLFAGCLNIQNMGHHNTGFNLQIKPLNITAIEVAWNKIMGGSHLFYNLIQSSPGLISRNTASDDYPSTLTTEDLIDFFYELAKNPEIYYLDKWKTDADAFMSCQCAKIICFMQLLLMIVDNIPTPPGFVGALLNCSNLADFNIESESNYNAQFSAIEPANFNMLKYLSSLHINTTAFNNGSGEYNDYTPNDYTSIANLQLVWRLLYAIIDTIQHLDVLDGQGLTCFLPYQTNITYRRSSFYIPSDTDNIDVVKGIIKAGLTVAGVAAVVIAGLAIRSSLKKKAFALEAAAGQFSWDAAKDGNIADMKKAYKLQKRANLLSIIGGYAQKGSADAIGSIISTNSDSDASVIEITKLIRG